MADGQHRVDEGEAARVVEEQDKAVAHHGQELEHLKFKFTLLLFLLLLLLRHKNSLLFWLRHQFVVKVMTIEMTIVNSCSVQTNKANQIRD